MTEGLGYDKRIGQAFLPVAGPGWGGSCLPKDTAALLQLSDSVDFEFRLLRAAIETNTRQSRRIVEKIRAAVTGARTGPLDPHADRAARAHVQGRHQRPARLARARGGRPAAAGRRRADGVRPGLCHGRWRPVRPARTGRAPLTLVDDPYVAAKDADAIVILTEWPSSAASTGPACAASCAGRSCSTPATSSIPTCWPARASRGPGVGRLPRFASRRRDRCAGR